MNDLNDLLNEKFYWFHKKCITLYVTQVVQYNFYMTNSIY